MLDRRSLYLRRRIPPAAHYDVRLQDGTVRFGHSRWARPALACALLLSAPWPPPYAASDKPRIEEIQVRSAFVPSPVAVRVWLPPRFEASPPGTVPLLVFLHDGFGSQRSFFRKGLSEILESMIARGELPGIAVACPRTVGTYNSNDYLGKRRTFDFLTLALVPELLARYPRLRRDPQGRGLTGISLGGYGALKIGLRHPELFGSVSTLSPWVEDLSFEFQMKQGPFGRWAMGRIFGKTPETSTIAGESLFRILAGTARPSSRPAFLVISGDADPWVLNGNLERFENALKDAAVPLEARRLPGEHDWPFWRRAFPEIARFHARAFRPQPSPRNAEP